jgi:hypothetical protein
MSVAASLCQSVLDALTDVDMPKRHPARTAQGSIEADGIGLPVYACDALVLGSGAAGWRAAVELKRLGIDVVVATQNLYGGTSAARDRTSRPCIRPRPAAMAMISSRLLQPSAPAAPWTKTPPMWKRWCARCRRCNISGYSSRSIGWVRCSGIKQIMTKLGTRRVAAPHISTDGQGARSQPRRATAPRPTASWRSGRESWARAAAWRRTRAARELNEERRSSRGAM